MGYSRREFLFGLTFWEVHRIIRGYRRRNILKYQLMRINAWASMFCMGNPEKKQPEDLFKLYFDEDINDEETDGLIPTDEDIARMREMMREENERAYKEKVESSEA